MTEMVETKIKTFKEFWPVYVLAHQDKRNRGLHFLATLSSIVLGSVFTLTHNILFLVLLPIVSYSLAWAGHLLQEGNLPLTWKQPIFSLIADHKMFFLILFGKMDQEIKKVKLSI